MWFKTILRRRGRTQAAADQQATPKHVPFARRQVASERKQPNRFVADEAFLRRMERLSLQAQRTLRGNPSSGEHPSRHQMPMSIFNDHRPYSFGDDLRYVDWNAYARHEQFIVKLGDAEQDVDVHLLLDVSRSMAWGAPSKLLVAQQLGAALGYLALAHSDRVHITPFSAAPLPSFGPTQGKGRLMDLLRFVEGIHPHPQAGLARAITHYARTHTGGGLVVICSDLLAEPVDSLGEALRALPAPRWQTLVLHILDPRELQPDVSGPLELEDAENGRRLELVLDAQTIAAYRRNVAVWQERIADACARRGATYASVQTNWPLERSIVPYLRARRVLK